MPLLRIVATFSALLAVGLVVSCRLGKDSPEDRPLPEPIPTAPARASSQPQTASPKTRAARKRRDPKKAGARSSSGGQPAVPSPQGSQPAPATATPPTDAGKSPTSDAAVPTTSTPPAKAPVELPAVPAQCIDKCQSVFKTCLKKLLLSDGGRPSPEVFASCEQAQSDCRRACVQP